MEKTQIELAIARAYARGKQRLALRMRISAAQKRRTQHRRLVLVHSVQKEK